jgi:glycosyltransferase involved in cell wall biosynthesis
MGRDRGYHLTIVGDGPERTRVADRLRHLELSTHVTFAGQVARDQVPGQLADIDCAVAPYPRIDGFYFSPLKVFEYMAAGRPIVASRIGQIESLLSDRATALLVEPGDPRRLADAIETLRRCPDVASQLGAAARRQAFARHGWTHTVSTALGNLEAVAS